MYKPLNQINSIVAVQGVMEERAGVEGEEEEARKEDEEGEEEGGHRAWETE